MFTRGFARITLPAAMCTGAALAAATAHGAERNGKDAKGGNHATTPIECVDGTQVLPWSCPARSQQLQRLKDTSFDVLVIGGGCVGAGAALDAATRGLSVGLVEAADFSAGTSGRSTKLIHGGVRYLEQAFWKLDKGMFDLVQEALEERSYMLFAAPYMNRPLPIMIPIYSWWEIPYMWVGVKMYDIIAGDRDNVPTSHFVNRKEALYQFPMLDSTGLKGAIVYYDGQMNDTRMNLMVALTAAQNNAAVANYVKVVGLTKDEKGNVNGARVRDVLTQEEWTVAAKTVINATGPFTDSIRHMDDPSAVDLVVPAAGVHCILPDHFSPERMGLIVPKTKDGRVLFFLPWQGSTLCGTTDSETGVTMLPRATEDDVSFILEESSRFLAQPVRRSDVLSTWSGIRPLIRDPKKIKKPSAKSAAPVPPDVGAGSEGAASSTAVNTAELSRNHIVEVLDSGLVTIGGGKWTTYRKMAEDAVDAAVDVGRKRFSSPPKPCNTKSIQLLGADRAKIVVNQKFDRIVVTLRTTYGLEKHVANVLVYNYGTRALQVAEMCRKDPKLSKKLHPRYPYLHAEVVFAARQEYACRAVDVLARRTRLAFLDREAAVEAAPTVVQLLASTLGWSKARQKEEMADVQQFLDTMEPVKKPSHTE